MICPPLPTRWCCSSEIIPTVWPVCVCVSSSTGLCYSSCSLCRRRWREKSPSRAGWRAPRRRRAWWYRPPPVCPKCLCGCWIKSSCCGSASIRDLFLLRLSLQVVVLCFALFLGSFCPSTLTPSSTVTEPGLATKQLAVKESYTATSNQTQRLHTCHKYTDDHIMAARK